jgi:synaptobrevin family protein YKT6
MAIQKDLDQTKAIMHDTIEAALERGVKLDELIEKSDDWSASSKMFYTTAKKHNQCCDIM